MSFLKLKILIIDDDPYYTKLLKKHLEAGNHAVFTAADKQDAMKIIREQKEKLLPIDLALVDYVIPKEDGIDISHSIKEIDPELFQVALTEHDAPEITKKLIQEGPFIQIMSKFDTSENLDLMLSVIMSSKKDRRSRERLT